MASYLLTETMSRRHELAMESYDRLFPNQDTMPRGGFGNLIALPLQRGPRNDGNTVFLDPDLDPWPDQWAFLAGLRRLSPGEVEAIAAEAQRNGLVTGVRAVEDEDDDAILRPWRALPRKSGPQPIRGPRPEKVRAVLAQRLFVEKLGLDSSLLDQIKRLAAFQNPEFLKKQNLRLSTALTPRVISCAEELPRFVSLPRGCVEDLRDLLAAHSIPLELEDERTDGDALPQSFRGRLTVRQDEAAQALLAHDTGVLVSPPGTGKTVIGAWLVAARARSTLVLVHRQPLLDQWVEQLSLHLGLDPAEIGRVGGYTRKPNGRLDVAMMQSLVRGEAVDELVGRYGHVVVDECHHVPAVSFERLLSAVRARYVVGLTATAKRRDGHHPILHMQVGPIRRDIGRAALDSPGELVRTLVVRETSFQGSPTDAKPSIQALYAALARDDTRNDRIVADVTRALERGRSPLVLTERRDHLDLLAERLGTACPNVVVLRGGAGARSRRETLARLRALPVDEPRLLLATGRYIGEGFDDSRLDTLFLALPISWRGTLVQYAGRLHRPHAGKVEARIVDYVDREVPMLARMFERRRTGYRSIGYREAAAVDHSVFPSDDGDLAGDRTGDPLESHKW
jgi:superfamily II DNA or RNA helicase